LDSAKASIHLMACPNSAAQPVDQQRQSERPATDKPVPWAGHGWQSRARAARMADRVAERAPLEAESHAAGRRSRSEGR